MNSSMRTSVLRAATTRSFEPHARKHRDALGHPIIDMKWRRFLFAHWRVDPAVMQAMLPPEVHVDTFDGSAWVGLVPFEMCETTFRRWPFLPGLRQFRECNVRTYIRHPAAHGEAHGVWFLSLDAAHPMPVVGGNMLWSLNYRHSRFNVREDGEHTSYALQRVRGKGGTLLEWETQGEPWKAKQGTLEQFLVERYSLFTKRFGRIMRGEVLHDPWPLRHARIGKLDDSLLAANGLPGLAAREPDHVMASDGLHVLGWGLRRSH